VTELSASCIEKFCDANDVSYINSYVLLKCSIGKKDSQSQWARGLRRESAAARFLELWVRIPPGHGCLSLVGVVCCHVQVSVPGRSLVEGSPTECGVSECDREASITWRPWPTGGCCAIGKRNFRKIRDCCFTYPRRSYYDSMACATVLCRIRNTTIHYIHTREFV
jgi:hypothetical protein